MTNDNYSHIQRKRKGQHMKPKRQRFSPDTKVKKVRDLAMIPGKVSCTESSGKYFTELNLGQCMVSLPCKIGWRDIIFDFMYRVLLCTENWMFENANCGRQSVKCWVIVKISKDLHQVNIWFEINAICNMIEGTMTKNIRQKYHGAKCEKGNMRYEWYSIIYLWRRPRPKSKLTATTSAN